MVLGLDAGEDLGEEGLLSSRSVLLATCLRRAPGGAAGAHEAHLAVAEGHDDEHGFGFALGDEGVKDEVGLADDGPAGGVVGEAVEQVEDGVVLLGFGVVAGWRVDEEVRLVLRCRPVTTEVV